MLQLANSNSALTMTSLEISELVNSRHDKVKQSIERLSGWNQHRPAVIQLPPLGEVKNHLGQSVSVYFINKRDSYIIVAQLSPEFTAALVDRWQELEGNQFKLPQSFAEALRLAADQQETIQQQAAQIEQQKPAVEFIERYVQSTGNLGFRQVCKLLKANEKEFRTFLKDFKIMYQLGGNWSPYTCHIVLGRFHVTTGTSDNDHNYTAAKFTPKGIQWITGLWHKHNNSELVEQ